MRTTLGPSVFMQSVLLPGGRSVSCQSASTFPWTSPLRSLILCYSSMSVSQCPVIEASSMYNNNDSASMNAESLHNFDLSWPCHRCL